VSGTICNGICDCWQHVRRWKWDELLSQNPRRIDQRLHAHVPISQGDAGRDGEVHPPLTPLQFGLLLCGPRIYVILLLLWRGQRLERNALLLPPTFRKHLDAITGAKRFLVQANITEEKLEG